LKDLYSPTTNARQVCAGSLVGQGNVTTEIVQPNQEPVTVEGHLLAFYGSAPEVSGTRERVPGIFAQVITTSPIALTYVLPFQIRRADGHFSTRLSVWQFSPAFECVKGPNCSHSPFTFPGTYSHISHFEMSLHRRFFHAGARQSFVTARCPAPTGKREATFPIVRIALAYFSTIEEPTATATGRCEPAGLIDARRRTSQDRRRSGASPLP
jgi:hypothetical protein